MKDEGDEGCRIQKKHNLYNQCDWIWAAVYSQNYQKYSLKSPKRVNLQSLRKPTIHKHFVWHSNHFILMHPNQWKPCCRFGGTLLDAGSVHGGMRPWKERCKFWQLCTQIGHQIAIRGVVQFASHQNHLEHVVETCRNNGSPPEIVLHSFACG